MDTGLRSCLVPDRAARISGWDARLSPTGREVSDRIYDLAGLRLVDVHAEPGVCDYRCPIGDTQRKALRSAGDTSTRMSSGNVAFPLLRCAGPNGCGQVEPDTDGRATSHAPDNMSQTIRRGAPTFRRSR